MERNLPTFNDVVLFYAKKDKQLPFVVPVNASKEVLEQLFKRQLKNPFGYCDTVRGSIDCIWKHPSFNRTNEKRKMLLESQNCFASEVLIEDVETTTDILQELFEKFLQDKNTTRLQMKALLSHQNLKMQEEEIREKMSKSRSWEVRLMVAEDPSTSNEKLNEMLIAEEIRQNELKKHESKNPENMFLKDFNRVSFKLKEVIINNPNFQMKEETKNILETIK